MPIFWRALGCAGRRLIVGCHPSVCKPGQFRFSSVHAPARSRNTIYAVSSGASRAGVTVIRVSGDDAKHVLCSLTQRSAPPKPRAASLAALSDPHSGDLLDRGLLLWFPGPNSYTGEDVVEFHVHGGMAVMDGMLKAIGSCPGTRGAEAGEFTRRAFENGKFDLTSAEGVADLINANSDEQRRLALRQVGGQLGSLYEKWRSQLIGCLAHVEAVIDFGEDEEIGDEVARATVPRVRSLMKEIQDHMADSRRGEIVRSGVSMVIAGAPNAGKSSFLNLLAQRPAAIVSKIPGTTRDVVEVTVDIGGYSIVVSDTAGLRDTSDEIEKEGIRRARARIEDADVRVYVVDVNGVVQQDDTLGTMQTQLENSGAGWWILLNKCDTISQQCLAESIESLSRLAPEANIHPLSCIDQDGFPALLEKLERDVKEKFGSMSSGPVITRARHRNNLDECLAHMHTYVEHASSEHCAQELAAEDLRLAAQALGKITGRVDVETVLDVVFKDFCIGK